MPSNPQDYLYLGQDYLDEASRKLIRQLVAESDDAPVTDTPSYESDPDTPKMPPGVKPVSPKDSQPKDGDKSDDPDESKPVKTTEDDGDSPDLYDEVDVQASAATRADFPHGTKCPACNAPTVFAELGFGPRVVNECASGHQYEARHAVAVRKPEREKLAKAAAEKPTKLYVPENWEMIKDMGTKDFTVWAGANDWENSWSAVAFQFHGNVINRYTTRVWGHIIVPPEADQGRQGGEDFGKGVVQSWLKTAKALRDAEGVSTHRPEHFVKAASHVAGLRAHGVEKVEWKSVEALKKPEREKAINERIKTAGDPPKESGFSNPEKGGPGSAPNPDTDTAPIDSDDVGKKPDLGKMSWYMGGLEPVTDKEGLAKWPLSFKRIEKDFKRPNKGGKGLGPKAKDSKKPDTKDQPYQMTTAPSKGLTKR